MVEMTDGGPARVLGGKEETASSHTRTSSLVVKGEVCFAASAFLQRGRIVFEEVYFGY